MRPIILEKLWKLRTPPFYPDVDQSDNAIKKEAIERSLNPLKDERVVRYYFDVYDWTSSNLIRDLSNDELGLREFPTARTLPRDGALMVLISGSMETGLDSFANLVLYRTKLAIGHTPFIVDVRLDSRDKVKSVASVAWRIITILRMKSKDSDTDVGKQMADIVKDMEEEYQRAKKEAEGRKDATYSDLFDTFRELLAPLKRQVVLQLTEGGDNDSWVRIYESVKSCCSYVIVMTPDSAYAKTCFDAMIALNRNIAWVRTIPLNRAKAGEYLAARLAAERVAGTTPPGPDPLFPFTADAIASLYEAGPTGGAVGPLTYPVGWLRRTLNQALTDQLEGLAKTHANATPESWAAMDPQTTRIGRAEMKKVWEKNNRKRP